MDKGAYEIIKLLLMSVEQSIKIDLADGTSRIIPIPTEKLLSELEKDQTLEKEANWLACQLERKEHAYGFCADNNLCVARYGDQCGYQGPDNWREAARKAVKEDTNV